MCLQTRAPRPYSAQYNRFCNVSLISSFFGLALKNTKLKWMVYFCQVPGAHHRLSFRKHTSLLYPEVRMSSETTSLGPSARTHYPKSNTAHPVSGWQQIHLVQRCTYFHCPLQASLPRFPNPHTLEDTPPIIIAMKIMSLVILFSRLKMDPRFPGHPRH